MSRVRVPSPAPEALCHGCGLPPATLITSSSSPSYTDYRNAAAASQTIMRILVVEDERRIASFISRGLSEHGYAVDVASDGEEALHWPDVAEFDVIILDIMLPVRDGIDVCRTLRRRGMRTPILMLTARDAVEDRVRGLDSGADDYLVKPFAFAELLARVRA